MLQRTSVIENIHTVALGVPVKWRKRAERLSKYGNTIAFIINYIRELRAFVSFMLIKKKKKKNSSGNGLIVSVINHKPT